MEEHADQKLTGIDLGQVEWYHRLRNELYHQGNGLTVERVKVDVYAELAKLLFKNLFGTDVVVDEEDQQMEMLGAFMAAWQRVERATLALVPVSMEHGMARPVTLGIRSLEEAGGPPALSTEYEELRRLRAQVAHGEVDRNLVTRELVTRVERLASAIDSLRKPGRGGSR